MLAQFFAYAGFLKLSRTPEALAAMGWHWTVDVPPSLITFLGIMEGLSAIGIISRQHYVYAMAYDSRRGRHGTLAIVGCGLASFSRGNESALAQCNFGLRRRSSCLGRRFHGVAFNAIMWIETDRPVVRRERPRDSFSVP
ncbi:DoxX family protein [Allorhizobium ampelinum]|uniref:DoxX family protein n=1 Tax=Allorhizobium ampelinum TaxID=3025782 RepID=UPI003AB9878B